MSYQLYAKLNKNYTPRKFRVGGKDHYQMFLGIKSDSDPNLEKVEKVRYTLHPTFKDRVRESQSRQRKFEIEIYAWGTFVVEYELIMTDGSSTTRKTDMAKVMERVEL